MKEYICKEDLIKATEETPFTMSMCLNKDECNGANIARLTFAKIFKVFPAADVVEVVHGKWMFDFALGGSNFYKCSECGRQECLLEKYNAEKYMPYCHCGARMDGGGDK